MRASQRTRKLEASEVDGGTNVDVVPVVVVEAFPEIADVSDVDVEEQDNEKASNTMVKSFSEHVFIFCFLVFDVNTFDVQETLRVPRDKQKLFSSDASFLKMVHDESMAALEIFDNGVSIEQIIPALERDGAVIIRDLLSKEVTSQIIEDLSETLEASTPGSKSGIESWEEFHGGKTVRFCGLAAKSRAFVDHALLNEYLIKVSDHYLLKSCADYWLNTGQVMAVGSSEPAQYLHRDEDNWPEAMSEDQEITFSCMYALSDFTKENGGTVVIPGSQNLPTGVIRGLEVPPEEIAYAVMPAGSGMIYSGKVVHGAGANITDQMRYGMHVSFVAGWLRPEEASPLVIDKETAATLPQRARQLLGWGSYHSVGGGRTWLVDFDDAEHLFD